MPLLSIIGCELFKKEIAQVLLKDGAIESLILVNGKDTDFKKTLEDTGAIVKAVSADSIPTTLKKSSGFNVIVAIQGVFQDFDNCKLNREIYEKIRFYGNISDGILLLYGHGDDELETVLSNFKRSRFYLKSIGSCMDSSSGNSMLLQHGDKADKREIDQAVVSVYEKLYSDIRAELGLTGQFT
ncbi:hypothetical protein [Methanolobus sp.]|uniref:hypothetical protein n=1 Tax=Methanolobus sp. TaxID=1874737 RepID=UPI0025FE9375|nr:hypothetical protein [Methanolobus sp.]